ncbi:MAG: Stp1/IreP family PP2C-type Ser/Thr phosphatase [Acutalibacteraceae bacterium]|nr:Stp1/IreP family PP2C-type Ser/Thr phosphatase [Clostridiales bacterium]
MKIVAKTDAGKVRKSNQDSYAAGELPNGVAWAVVCDGMGGSAGGNIASSTAVKMISEQITSGYREGMSTLSIENILVTAITNANISIFDMSRANEELKGMGTTVVAAIIANNVVYIAHAGDSRAYLVSEDGIKQITKDHSVVQAMVETGELTPEQAKIHPRKNLITRALGVNEDIKIDFCEQVFSNDNVLLMCTDGLTNYVEADDIYNITSSGKYYEFADKLVELANNNGGGDNITVVVVAN